MQEPPQIIIEFAMAIKTEQWSIVENLLDEQGKYEIMNYQLSFAIVNKYQFLEWLKLQKQNIDIQQIQYDTTANDNSIPVIIFNNGLFPNIIIDTNQKLKHGMAIINDLQQINRIYFCDEFSTVSNYPILTIMEMAIQDLIKEGWTEHDAIKKIYGNDAS